MNELVIGEFRAACAASQPAWAATPVRRRLVVLARLRRLLGREAAALAATVPGRPAADTLMAEILPLAEAARFLVRDAARLLAIRRLGFGRPLWLFGVSAAIRREPCGTVLVLAPGNYPLFLAGAQVLQALAAGNAVAVKPAPGCTAPMAALAALLARAGLPAGLLAVLPEQAGPEAVRAGFDRIVLTGSAETGRRVLAAAADTLTPATMELSGADPVFVLPGADLALVTSCLLYGLRLNGGATCIAPRRVFVPPGVAADLAARLAARLAEVPDAAVPPGIAARLAGLVAEAEGQGARRLTPDAPGRPVVLVHATPDMALLRQDVFAPWLAIVASADPLADAARCPYALGASVFGPVAAARRFADQVRAGSVCVNDLIVPTADPRLPFGGRGESGFGLTRGAEGLLEMTVVKTVSVRGRFRPHLAPPRPGDAARFAQMLRWLHGAPWMRE